MAPVIPASLVTYTLAIIGAFTVANWFYRLVQQERQTRIRESLAKPPASIRELVDRGGTVEYIPFDWQRDLDKIRGLKETEGIA